MKDIRPIFWKNQELKLIDQTLLPSQEVWHTYTASEDAALAISNMIVRGAPAIGVTAAFGLVLSSYENQPANLDEANHYFKNACERFSKTRPTAVNLFWAIDRMKNCAHQISDLSSWSQRLEQEALAIQEEDYQACKTMGDLGAELINANSSVLTHCNAGALATAGWGTALGVIRSASLQGKIRNVFVDETRPFLQGSRLTAWEMVEENIPATLISDNMAGYFMSKGEIDAIIVGSDRIAANGDVANKIGTYSVAVLAKEHGIPFYVAAPISTIDMECKHGDQIPIEERSPEEVKKVLGQWSAPQSVHAKHPAFDVTPNKMVTAIITEKGVIRAPYEASIKTLF